MRNENGAVTDVDEVGRLAFELGANSSKGLLAFELGSGAVDVDSEALGFAADHFCIGRYFDWVASDDLGDDGRTVAFNGWGGKNYIGVDVGGAAEHLTQGME